MADKAQVNENLKRNENLKLYAAFAGAIVIIAIASTIFVNVSSGSNHGCGVLFKQQSYNCLYQLAYSTSNISLCKTLPSSYANPCYSAIAEKINSSADCTMASDPNVSSGCIMHIANSTGNIRLCAMLNTSFAQSCIQTMAVRLGKSSLCIQVVNGTNRQICYSSVYLGDALMHMNGSYCRMIPNNNATVVSSVLNEVNRSVLNSSAYINITEALSYTDFSNTTIGIRDACYIGLAYSTMNRSYCSGVASGVGTICNISSTRFNYTQSNNANVSAANLTAFMNFCEQQGYSNNCNSSIQYLKAASARNITGCQGLSPTFTYQCYYGLAQRYNNANYCSYISNVSINAACISAIKNGYGIYNGTTN